MTGKAVRSYAATDLQIPEALIFINHSEQIIGKRVLDIGCGSGRIAAYLRHIAGSYLGIDYSPVMINFCKEHYAELDFAEADARDMSMLGDGEFDFALFAYNGIDTLAHEDRLEVLSQTYRILNDDGLLVFSSHNRNCRAKGTPPRLELSPSPCRMLSNVIIYCRALRNSMKNKTKEHYSEKFEIINDSTQNFKLLNYYIDKKQQAEQLEQTGFRLLEMYDNEGRTMLPDDNDEHCGWIYYVARKHEKRK